MQKIKIKSINKISKRDRYDLTVPETSNFYANGILIHNTSQRVGTTYDFRHLSIKDKIAKFFGVPVQETFLRPYNGTRRVILSGKDNGHYDEVWRQHVADRIQSYIPDHMIAYMEVVGWHPAKDANGKKIFRPIMNSVCTKKLEKEKRKMYGDTMTFSYGCKEGEFDIYVYRLAYVLPNGKVVDLTWDEVKYHCDKWKIKHVPEMDRFIYDGNEQRLMDYIESLVEGPDLIDPTHIREGVCVRVDSSRWSCFKHKSWTFKYLEGIIKDNDEPDMEEMS